MVVERGVGATAVVVGKKTGDSIECTYPNESILCNLAQHSVDSKSVFLARMLSRASGLEPKAPCPGERTYIGRVGIPGELGYLVGTLALVKQPPDFHLRHLWLWHRIVPVERGPKSPSLLVPLKNCPRGCTWVLAPHSSGLPVQRLPLRHQVDNPVELDVVVVPLQREQAFGLADPPCLL